MDFTFRTSSIVAGCQPPAIECKCRLSTAKKPPYMAKIEVEHDADEVVAFTGYTVDNASSCMCRA